MVATIDKVLKALNNGDVVIWKINNRFRSVVEVVKNGDEVCSYKLRIEMLKKENGIKNWHYFDSPRTYDDHITTLYETLTKGLVQ